MKPWVLFIPPFLKMEDPTGQCLIWDGFWVRLVWLIANVQTITTTTLLFITAGVTLTAALPDAHYRCASFLRNRPHDTISHTVTLCDDNYM